MTLFQIQYLSGRIVDVPRRQYKIAISDCSFDGRPFRVRTSYIGRTTYKRLVLRPIEVTLADLLVAA